MPSRPGFFVFGLQGQSYWVPNRLRSNQKKIEAYIQRNKNDPTIRVGAANGTPTR